MPVSFVRDCARWFGHGCKQTGRRVAKTGSAPDCCPGHAELAEAMHCITYVVKTHVADLGSSRRDARCSQQPCCGSAQFSKRRRLDATVRWSIGGASGPPRSGD